MLRGLQIRINYGIANIQDGYDGLDGLMAALYEAEALGVHEGRIGIECKCPVMFMDEPALGSAWFKGAQFSSDLEEMYHCSGCNNGTGDPYQQHG